MTIALLGLGCVVLVVAAWLLRGAVVAKAAAAARPGVAESAEAEAIRAAARAEAAAEAASVVSQAREQALAQREALQAEASAREAEASRRAEAMREKETALFGREQALTARQAALSTHDEAQRAHDHRRQAADDARKALRADELRTLEARAGEPAEELRRQLIAEWVDEARGEGEEQLRRLAEGVNDPEHMRESKRVMGIAMQRYQGHYLTERMLSNLQLVPGTAAGIFGASQEYVPIIEEVANIKLAIAEDGSSVRLEGQDSFGREIARRAIARFGKQAPRGDVKQALEAIRDNLEKEVFDLGKRAFRELEIPRAHADIVRLVGRLNWRTSYTQNQWKHAVEVAFLCGMMADELGLDVKIARRAALMHDIGKSLTHAIDGSHAVIGADYARRLGESELVANAIGAHHTDEPFNSTYAYLVAAADALSGARPGARREQSDNYLQKLDDLERIGCRFPGVENAFAVQGGREVRVYVREDKVSDERAVELSTEIAHKISEEMTFPGQIKVTVVREVRVVSVAN